MGYTTEFKGKFKLDRPLEEQVYQDLLSLNETRRMKRAVDSDLYGVQGEFYFKDDNLGVIDCNQPPETQPGLWCNWKPTEDKQFIEWDQGEKFYSYVEWIYYIINRILKPKKYILNGEVEWLGEEQGDIGTIIVIDNIVFIKAQGIKKKVIRLERFDYGFFTQLNAVYERVK